MAKKMGNFLGYCFLPPQIARFSWPIFALFLAKTRRSSEGYEFQ